MVLLRCSLDKINRLSSCNLSKRLKDQLSYLSSKGSFSAFGAEPVVKPRHRAILNAKLQVSDLQGCQTHRLT